MASEFARLLKTALARRIAFVLVALVLTWAGIGRAQAQGYPTCGTNPRTCTQAEAEQASSLASEQNAICYQVYGNDPDFTHASLSSGPTVQNVTEDGGEVASYVKCHFSWGGPINGGWMIKSFIAQDCSAKSPLPAGYWQGTNTAGDTICTGGCKFKGDGTGVGFKVDDVMGWYYTGWSPTGETCTVAEESTPGPEDSDGDGKSDGNDTAPNNPGQSGGGGEDTGSSDGGPQGNGPGEGSGNGNTSGGGGNCASPPSSTGDAILAQIAYQTWATRCAIEGAKDGNGNLKTTQGGSGTGTGDGEGQDNNGTDFGTSNPPAPEEFDPGEHKRFGIPIDSSLLDSEAIFGAGTCPVLSVTVYGKTFSTSEFSGWCDLLRIIRALVLIFGAFTALRILMGHNA